MKDALGEMQSVLVLGGTSDIALATVRKIVARRSARLVIAARKTESCETAAATLRDVHERVRDQLQRHDLPSLPVNVTLTAYHRTTRRELS